ITKGDALVTAEKRDAKPAPVEPSDIFEPELPRGEASDGRVTRKRMSPLRRKIAQQLVMAQQTAAILTTFNECDMSEVQSLRGHAQEAFTKKHGTKLGFMSFFI